jgi:hypothetical protein
MKITISVLGRFQLFHLARELQEHGYLRSEAARRAMGASARERVKQGFTWKDYGERMIAHYHRILATT